MTKKVKHLIDPDMEGPPKIFTELIVSCNPYEDYATLHYRGEADYILQGPQLKNLFEITTKQVARSATALAYKIKLIGQDKPTIMDMIIDPEHIMSLKFEIDRSHTDLALHLSGGKKLSNEQLKQSIIGIYNDNFEILKQLRKHGVLKNVEKTIKQVIPKEKY